MMGLKRLQRGAEHNHYCSSEGFKGIIASKRLWFSDLSRSNDPRELKLGYTKFIETLESIRNGEYRGVKGDFIETLEERLSVPWKTAHFYCCCFSEIGDALPMWGAYGANYSGISLGFKPTTLFGIDARIQKVKYLDDTIAKNLRDLTLDIVKEIEILSPAKDWAYWVYPTIAILATLTSLKHISWNHEREIRMIHSQGEHKLGLRDELYLRKHGLISGGPLKRLRPLIRKSKSGNVEYLEFQYGRYSMGSYDPKLAIEEVIIGPNCGLTTEEVEKTMIDNGFEGFKIRKSDCQIR